MAQVGFTSPVPIGMLLNLASPPVWPLRGTPGTAIFWGVPGGQPWTPNQPQDVNAPQGTGHSLGRQYT